MPSDPSDSARRTAHFRPIGHASHLQQQHPASPLSQGHRVSRRISSPSPPLIPARTPQQRQHPPPFNSNQKKQTQTPKCQPSPPPSPTAALTSGLALTLRHRVAAACIPPYAVPLAAAALAGSSVRVCAVVGFPHGTSTTTTKIFEAVEAMDSGAHEVDVVVNVGKVLSGEWEYVRVELKGVNEAVVGRGGVVKVIFENDFLGEAEIAELARVCAGVGVGWVKTSTGFGFVKMGEGYGYRGARGKDIKVMRENCGAARIKAAGGLRTLDEVLWAVKLGAERVGATATEEILAEASRRGVGDEMGECEFVVPEREREEGL